MRRMRIIMDAMGGDNAPRAAVLGAVDAAREFGCEITLVGRETELRELLREAKAEELAGLRIENAERVIPTAEHPTAIMRAYRDCSMARALDLLRAGEGDAVVSAGNSGALLTGATLICKRIHGIRRAAFAPILPTANGGAVLCDSGANAECTPELLLQFGLLGASYAECALGKKNPACALLNIGAEETKGTSVHAEANALLRKADEDGLLHFAGNIEAREVMDSACSVIIADGFSGNILLKAVEGTALFFAGEIKRIFTRSLLSKLAALLVLRDVRAFKARMDYKEVGGAPLLGVACPVIKAHGSSDPRAFRGAIRQAIAYASSDTIARITENVADFRLPGRE